MRKKTLVLLNQQRINPKRNADSEYPNSNCKTSTSTPHLFLPKIGSNPTPVSPHSINLGSLDTLEQYIHSLISERQSQIVALKKQKKMREDFQNKKESMAHEESAEKKKIYKRHIRHLQQKLRQLQGDLQVEQKKLEVGHTIQEKMMVQYKEVYDTLHNRVRRGDKKDELTQTETTQTAIQIQQSMSVPQNPPKKPGYFKRKFRIIGYVVYYSLAFPKYVKIFRQLRKQYFQEQVPQAVFAPVQDYIKLLSALKLAQLQRQKERKSRKSSQFAPSFSFEEVDEEGGVKIKSIPVETIEEIVVYLLSKIKEAVEVGSLDSLLRSMSFHFMNRSFLSDHLFLIDQLYRLKIAPSTQQILLQKQQEVQLLLNFLIGKLTCFNFMIISKKDPKIFRRNSKMGNNNKNLTRTLLLGGLFLFSKCNVVNQNPQLDEKLKRQGNIQNLDRDKLPIPMNELEISQKFDLGAVEEKNKRISIQMKIEESSLNNEGLKYKNMMKAEDILNNFNISSQRSRQIQGILRQIGQLAHRKCWEFRIKHFLQIQQHALFHQHYLTKELETEQYSKKKLPNQALEVQSYISLVVQARTQLKTSKNPFQNSTNRSIAKIMSSKTNSLSYRKSIEKSYNPTLQPYTSKQNVIFEQISQSSGTKHHYRQSLSKHKGTKSGEIVMSELPNEIASKGRVRLNAKNRQVLNKRLNKIDEVVEKDQKDS